MKKILLIYFLVLTQYAFTDDVIITENEDSSAGKNRIYKIGFLFANAGISNNHFSADKLFQEKLIIDFQDFSKGFKFNFNLDLYPLSFSYYENDAWGFGFSLGAKAEGMMRISGNMITLSNADDDKSYAGGAVFAEIKSFYLFNFHGAMIKISPTVFYPVFYVNNKPGVKYSMSNSSDSTTINLQYEMVVYSAFSMESESVKLSALPGVDFHLSAEYPLAEKLGLKEKYSFLDFIAGVDIIGVPMIPALIKDYMEISGHVNNEQPLSTDNFDNVVKINELNYGSRNEYILRPFKMLVWADWKPFETIPAISFIPVLGFSISPFYEIPIAAEIGIKARYNLAGIFYPALGIGYYDRLWKNSLDIALKFKHFEFDVGILMSSQDFLKSWQGNGFGMSIGFNFVGY